MRVDRYRGSDEDTHRANADLLTDVLRLVDIDLVKVDGRELLRQFLKDGRDDPARTAPGRPEVEDGDAIAVNLHIAPHAGSQVSPMLLNATIGHSRWS